MKVIAKREQYTVGDVVCNQADIDSLQVFARHAQIMHLKSHAEKGTVCESVPAVDPVILVVGPYGCATLDTASLQTAVAAQRIGDPIDAWTVQVDEMVALEAEGGDYRKDVIIDGKPLCEYLGLDVEGDPWSFGEVLKLLTTPDDEAVQSQG